MRIKKYFAIATVVALACVVGGCQSKSSEPKVLSEADLENWSQDTEGLTSEYSTDFPLLNVYIDNPVLGNEFEFVRIAPWNEEDPTDISAFQTGKFTIEAGKFSRLENLPSKLVNRIR